MIKAQYTKRNHMLSIIDTNVSRTPTVSAKTGCVDIIFADDETAIAVRDAITAEHPFEPKEPPASAVDPITRLACASNTVSCPRGSKSSAPCSSDIPPASSISSPRAR